jgi:hypothetical protein
MGKSERIEILFCDMLQQFTEHLMMRMMKSICFQTLNIMVKYFRLEYVRSQVLIPARRMAVLIDHCSGFPQSSQVFAEAVF